MKDLSVRGIARKHDRRTGDFWLREDWLAPHGGGVHSLRDHLVNIARSERDDVEVQNCPHAVTTGLNIASGVGLGALIGGLLAGPFGFYIGAILGGAWGYHHGVLIRWPVKFEQTWTHIVVRIWVVWLADSNQDDMLGMWKDAIEECWSDRWGCKHGGEVTCPLTFEIEWLDAPGNHHYLLIVTNEVSRTAFCWWSDQSGAWPAVHEFGHMLGLADEYEETHYPCPGRDDVNNPGPGIEFHNDSIMGTGGSTDWVPASAGGTATSIHNGNVEWRMHLSGHVNQLFLARHFRQFADYLGSELVRIRP